jgi:hypothetical protein
MRTIIIINTEGGELRKGGGKKMKNHILNIFILLLLASAALFPFKVYAQEAQNNFTFNNHEFTNFNYNVNREFDYSNHKNLKENKQLGVIKQKGRYNKAEIWQKSYSTLYGSNEAYIVQIGNDNKASIKQFSGANRAMIKQYGFNNRAEIEQFSGYNNLRINQFGNNDNLKIIQN